MDSAPEFMSQYRNEPPAEKVDELKKLVKLADQTKLWIDAAEAELETTKKVYQELVTKHIPDQMDQIGTNVFGIPDTDRECRVEPYYHAVMKPETLDEGVEWLDSHGYGDVVKHSIHVDFDREDAEKAKSIAQRISQMLAEYEVTPDTVVVKSYGVHWKTLTSLVKRLVEEEVAVPLETLGATVGRVAKIIKRKKK